MSMVPNWMRQQRSVYIMTVLAATLRPVRPVGFVQSQKESCWTIDQSCHAIVYSNCADLLSCPADAAHWTLISFPDFVSETRSEFQSANGGIRHFSAGL
uniref:Putative secreted protein n=1 Tax=Anopheles marajoara TaxID=58244 RepID=A0A2M4C8Z7_9DIPT